MIEIEISKQNDCWLFEIGVWNLFGICNLEFEIINSG